MRIRLRQGGTLVKPEEILLDESGFLTEVAVRGIGPGNWLLLEPLVYEASEDLFTVPAGFHTDFASVPRLLRSIVSETGVHTRAAVLHDYLGRDAGISQRDADGIFRQSLRRAGVRPVLRWLMWAAVRFGSGMEGATAKEWVQIFIIFSALFLLALLFLCIVSLGVMELAF